jgi:hypothetical protein
MHIHVLFPPSCVSIPQGCGDLARKDDKCALCHSAIGPMFSFLSY